MEKLSRSFTLEELQALPSDTLNAMVHHELESGNHNEALILQMLSILEQRDSLDTLRKNPIVQDARAKFQAYYIATAERATQERRRRTGTINRWLIRAASVAAIACILIFAVPRAFGAEDAWELISRWSDDLFSFFDPAKGDQEEEDRNFHSDNPDLLEVYETVAAQGAEKPIVPQWIPDGMTMTELNVSFIPGSTKVHVRFEGDAGYIVFSFERYGDVTSNKYFKESEEADAYELLGIKHYFLINTNSQTVAWSVANWECSIATNLVEEETLQRIVDSIYQEAN